MEKIKVDTNLGAKLNSKPIKEVIQKKKEDDRGTPIEDAIALCGYGKFHYFLFVATVLGQISSVISTSDGAFLLASAECDLKLSLEDKGILTAVPFGGMIASGLLTGFLSDAFGRKIFLVWGHLALAICKLIQSTSQTFMALLILKFMEGFIFAGPFTVIVTYLGELHDNKMRSKILMFSFCFVGVSNVILPLVGWGILTQDWSVDFFDGKYMFRSWHAYLMVNSVWSISTCIMFSFLPESPKFLLAHRRHDEALAILRKIFATNSGKAEENYPVKKVYINAMNKETNGFIKSLIDSFKNLKPLCKRPHITTLIHICVMQFGMMLSLNTLRLWYPQLSTIFENYSKNHNETVCLCQVINEYLEKKELTHSFLTKTNETEECISVRSGSETYITSAILGVFCIIPFLVSGLLVNKIGRKLIIFISMGICGLLASTLYLAISSIMIVSYFAIFVALAQMSVCLLLTVTVDSFPTAFRALSVAALMLMGRCGTLLGNIFFPYLLKMGCLVPFIIIAFLCLVSSFLGLFVRN